MALGDVLFYEQDGSIDAAVICWWTHGPFVHVEVDMGDGTAIGALPGGVSRHVLAPPPWRWRTLHYCSADDLAAGLRFLTGTLSTPYSYRDVLDAGPLRLLGVLLSGRGYDCSHLVADFLIQAGLADRLGPLADTPQRCSPNDLARAVGLLRKDPEHGRR